MMNNYFYSASMGGFGNLNLVTALNIPKDAVDVTDEQRLALLLGESQGKLIASDKKGFPVLVDPPSPEKDWPAAIAAIRYIRETGGLDVSGIAIDTGRDSQALITGAVLASMQDPTYTCNWKTPAGFVELSAEQLGAISIAVRKHVQACFDREAALLEMVGNGSFTEAALGQGWP